MMNLLEQEDLREEKDEEKRLEEEARQGSSRASQAGKRSSKRRRVRRTPSREMKEEEDDEDIKERRRKSARTARISKVQNIIYHLLRGAEWASGRPLKALEEKLAKSPFPNISVREWRTSSGEARAAQVHPSAPLAQRTNTRKCTARHPSSS